MTVFYTFGAFQWLLQIRPLNGFTVLTTTQLQLKLFHGALSEQPPCFWWRCIMFWNSNAGASVNTGSQVCSLLWNTHEREILSGHVFNDNQLTLWKYPSMVRVVEHRGHASRVLGMAQILECFWNAFTRKYGSSETTTAFADVPRIR